jgi:ribosome-associated translation inhibitor RaiA
MDYMFTFKDKDPNKQLMKSTREKLRKIVDKYCRKALEAHVTFSKEGVEFHSWCRFKGAGGLNCEVSSKSHEQQSSVDLMLAKFEKTLKRKKEKLKGHNNKLNQKFSDKNVMKNSKSIFDRDWDAIPVDADDIVKYEKARLKKYG